MIKLVDLEKKNSRIIYIKFLTNIKKINNYLDEELIGSSFALTFVLSIIRLGLQSCKEEKETVKERNKIKKLTWSFT